ncbi:MAG: glycosyltransferase [Bacteroidota bacterium]
MLEIIILVIISAYFIQSATFLSAAGRSFKRLSDSELPSASVIVAVRNEEKNILRCMQSLAKLEYPADRMEIIIADDGSTDATAQIVKDFICDKPVFRYCSISGQTGHLKGKTNALAEVIPVARGEIILTTDADCAVSPLWAKTICSYYTDDVALVCGFTTQTADSQFTGMQALDFIYLLSVASGSMNAGLPLSCIGNNMSYRKSVYHETGGYHSLPFSITEDFALLRSIAGLKKYKLIYPTDPEALIESLPCSDIKSLYWQKKRWGVGGLSSSWKGFIVMASGFLANLCVLLLPFFFTPVLLYLTIFKICTDAFLLYTVLKKLRLSEIIKYFFAFEIYFMIYVLALPAAVISSRKVIWKGRKY